MGKGEGGVGERRFGHISSTYKIYIYICERIKREEREREKMKIKTMTISDDGVINVLGDRSRSMDC